MITIYTRTNNIFKKEFWKYFIKKSIGRYSGPDAVLFSLQKGLSELGIPFEINPKKPQYEIVHVLSGISILQEMIKEKTNGKIKTLVAGPTLVRTPYDYNNIIQDKNIDCILFPSDWTKDFYSSLVPQLKDKINIWPAGVEIPEQTSTKEKILIFRKNISDDIYEKVIEIVKNRGLQFDTIQYGKYTMKEYRAKLLSASLLIYLQPTESQGLALQEAWSYDVPTLVWKNTEWRYGEYHWSDNKISAPYLTEEAGLLFTLDTLPQELDNIIDKKYNFNPRKYCASELSIKASTLKYLEIIKKNQQQC